MDSPVTQAQYATQLSDDTLRDMYRAMLLSRRLDERCWALHRQGKIAFHVSAIGHEGLQVAAAFALNRGIDFTYPYYRDLAFCIALGLTPLDFMLSVFGKAGEPSSGGRQMPSHWSSREKHIVSQSSVVAVQVPQAAGTAFAINYKRKVGLLAADDTTQPRLAYASVGEGGTSQGEWHEAMNWAGIHKLPFICMVENNQYAISVPFDKQSAVPLVERAHGYGVIGVQVDGNDVFATYDAVRAAAERAYTGEGATLIEAITYRLVPHSSDDDDRSYRTREEVQEWKQKDPLLRFQAELLNQGVLTQARIDAFEEAIQASITEAQQQAEAAPDPDIASGLSGVYAEETI
ncbi:thiamine pyrophosphate-dependent dehydrogenase E1 component subunit alpha [Phototrophicus methaneseepsis]|uniref:2-oxoisovalerate dehydrogenase subunit alpha n=1 Tax=Phototrophicus methaneseepsis TaxID=2710758 RepID=A0A7S8E7X8_9CHLR|nr:thiamine pyrophosphate-dependent dehydrogenase E1 component subunit alpha [Phototrophicus methaneseepsis]QPC81999.1 thiamine pyrophosphate-dependent dehydrogenase E1 component subunit alpha [Phototrophicus methaneseepsis]